jgi:hypothetical protein
LINNRQNGRRRGRGGGGGGPRVPGQSPNPGNRQENRSRGNAAQLHEKYKALARDAQMQGDRVQTEYYLQFADHYFRVLNEGRPRFEEQRPRRDDFSDEDEDQDETMLGDGDDRDERDEQPYREQRPERADRERQARDDRPERFERPYRDDRPERAERQPREGREDRPQRQPREVREDRPREDRVERAERPERQPREERGDRPQRIRPRARPRDEEEGQNEERISLEVLPPAIAADNDGAEKPARRRTRRPRPDGEEIAPAA